MRLLSTGLVALGLVALVGCNTSPPGGSGGTKTTTGGTTSGRSATFTIKAPTFSTSLKQGDTKEVKLTVDRGKDFHDDVELKFDAPAGVTVDPATHTVKSGDKEDVEVKVSAAKDAGVGEHVVKVTGTPKTGSATSVEFKVKVDKSEAK
jgi:uncharacterized membrane protein